MEWTETLLRLTVAFLLGSALGFERQWRQRMAGLRTNTLVATGACLFVILSIMTPGEGSPTRIAAQVVSGIGFLAGGVILKEGITVKGLNTAATLWCAAAIGTLSGAGFFSQAIMGACAVLIANTVLRPLSLRINQQPTSGTELEFYYLCSLVCRGDDEAHIRMLLLDALSKIDRIKLHSLQSQDLDDFNNLVEIKAEIKAQKDDDNFLERIVSRLCLEPAIKSASWRIIEQ